MELHTTSDKKVIIKLLKEDEVDINIANDIGDSPLHTLVRKAAANKKAFDLLWSYLVFCNSNKFDVNIKSKQEGNTALHIAAEKNDLDTVKALVVFDAEVNCLNFVDWSPMDHAILNKNQEMVEFLQTRDSVDGSTLRRMKLKGVDIPDSMPVHLRDGGGGLPSLKMDGSQAKSKVSTGETPLELSIHDGQRILCLDGGGLKGLIIIEILIYIEKLTGRKIVELFDWIVGTSAGGIIALALVYAKKTLQELKQLFFLLKDEVFGTANKYGFGCDGDKFSEILKSYFGEEIKLSHPKFYEPKVMVSAIDCSKTDLKLVFFNNCFLDEDIKYRDVLVWKVARYTSSAPVYFEPEDNYIDGGIKANNPTDCGLTKIQSYYDLHQEKTIKYACVVSVGCGEYPADELGDFSIQKYMTPGWRTFQIYKFFGELQNLLCLLGNAVSNEEEIAASCRLRCEKQGIPFYRFSPPFNDVKVPVGETDAKKLCGLILMAQSCLTSAWSVPIHRLAELLKRVEKSRIQKEGFQHW